MSCVKSILCCQLLRPVIFWSSLNLARVDEVSKTRRCSILVWCKAGDCLIEVLKSSRPLLKAPSSGSCCNDIICTSWAGAIFLIQCHTYPYRATVKMYPRCSYSQECCIMLVFWVCLHVMWDNQRRVVGLKRDHDTSCSSSPLTKDWRNTSPRPILSRPPLLSAEAPEGPNLFHRPS